MAEKIEVTVDAEGKASIHIKGVKGKSCLDITKELDKILGAPESRELTAEFRQAEDRQKARAGR